MPIVERVEDYPSDCPKSVKGHSWGPATAGAPGDEARVECVSCGLQVDLVACVRHVFVPVVVEYYPTLRRQESPDRIRDKFRRMVRQSLSDVGTRTRQKLSTVKRMEELVIAAIDLAIDDEERRLGGAR